MSGNGKWAYGSRNRSIGLSAPSSNVEFGLAAVIDPHQTKGCKPALLLSTAYELNGGSGATAHIDRSAQAGTCAGSVALLFLRSVSVISVLRPCGHIALIQIQLQI